jgi:hypothetical protein
MNHLATILGIFAAPPERQALLLPDLPENHGATDFFTNFERNPLLVAVLAFIDYFSQGDNESREEYLERMGLPLEFEPVFGTLGELDYVLRSLRPTSCELWSRKALERKLEWRLVRRLAGIVLAENGWPGAITVSDAAPLLHAYSERLRNDWREYGRPW